MATGVYLTKGVSDIFDSMEKMGIKKVNRIIGDLRGLMANGSAGFTSMIDLNKEKVAPNVLKIIFDKKYTDKDLEDFVKVFKNIEGKDTMGLNKKQIDKEQLPIKFTDDFWVMLDRIDNEVAWSLIGLDQSSEVKNKLGIDKLDTSDKDFYFDIYFENGKKRPIKIIEFINTYLPQKFTRGQIYDFTKEYNKIKNEVANNIQPENTIKVPEFKFNPKDVRSTFLSLVTETYPYGTEDEVTKYLPELNTDKFGNYYKIIGDSDTMFTSHLDTASRDKESISLISMEKNGQELIMSDGTTILGADDKAGVTVMLYMMAHNVPGIYYFFLGEERGGIGSGKVADAFHTFSFLKGIKKVISFDRRNYYSVITEQAGSECCSDAFGESLCKELNKSGMKLGLDPTGVFTDSANFIDVVPECTNISVGYFNEHTHDELQNITYLTKLAEACVSANWNNLVIQRKVGFDDALLKKWNSLIKDIKDSAYFNELTIKGSSGRILISLEFDDTSLKNAYEDLAIIDTILLLHKCEPDVKFDGNIIKIEID